MKLTEEKLVDLGACADGLRAFRAQEETDVVKLLAKLSETSNYEWFRWLASRMMTHEQCVRWSVFCAEQVLGIFERDYPQHNSPRLAIAAAIEWAACPTEANAIAARDAARHATSAGYAAKTASYAAKTAGYAAKTASYAATAAGDAATTVVYAATAAVYAATAAASAATAAGYAAADGSAAVAARQKFNRTCEDEAIRILAGVEN